MTINIENHTDAFTHHVYLSIDANVRATFTPKQVHAIETAIRANKPFQKHPVDVRGVIPLYFLKLYFVFLMGRDKRSKTKSREAERQKSAIFGSALLSVYLILSMLLPVVFLVLYILKSMAGIDLFPGVHLSDFLP